MTSEHNRQTHGGLERVAVVVPAYNAGAALADLAQRLAALGFGALVVVDDGSSVPCAEALEGRAAARTHVLRHARNRGKGAALKTGFRFVLEHLEACDVVVTADADGQHLAGDIVRVAEAGLRQKSAMAMGVRGFRGAVPLRSRVGNGAMCGLVSWIVGAPLRDTQTGLRAVPRGLLGELLRVEGERYEYETAMLLELCRSCGPAVEVPIETVYLEGNAGSHFRPLADSLRVLGVLARHIPWPRVARNLRRTEPGGRGHCASL